MRCFYGDSLFDSKPRVNPFSFFRLSVISYELTVPPLVSIGRASFLRWFFSFRPGACCRSFIIFVPFGVVPSLGCCLSVFYLFSLATHGCGGGGGGMGRRSGSGSRGGGGGGDGRDRRRIHLWRAPHPGGAPYPGGAAHPAGGCSDPGASHIDICIYMYLSG